MKKNIINRLAKLALPKGQSAFLWGARNTGKSTFLRSQFPQAQYYDLLESDRLTQLLAAPHQLREELQSLPESTFEHPVIIDEIQKVPLLLNEVQWLIERKNIGFILCGSSARKLKRGAANLLGGRAWRFTFYPLVYKEIDDFDLIRALNHGLLPSHYLSNQPKRALRAYTQDYLKEEIQAEGLVRNLPAFARFLDAVGFSIAEMVNYSNIARQCHIDSKSVKEYYQILVDTLIGYLILPFHKKVGRELITATPKFYLFDVGVANYMARTPINAIKGSAAGKAFESFILMELVAFLGLHENDAPINYWRSKSGLEVDFILDYGAVAIEVKISDAPSASDLKGLIAFSDDYQPKHALVVCLAPTTRVIKTPNANTVTIIPWTTFLQQLWDGAFM